MNNEPTEVRHSSYERLFIFQPISGWMPFGKHEKLQWNIVISYFHLQLTRD